MAIGVQTMDSPTRPEGALGPYLRAIAAHQRLVVLVTLLTVGASIAWVVVRSPTYEATAGLLVTAVPQDDTTFVGVQVLKESAEPERMMQTAATLVESRRAAELTAARLGSGWTTDAVEDAVKVEPQGESTIVALTARDEAASEAADIANVYAASALEARRTDLRRQVDAAIAQLRQQQEGAGREVAGVALDVAQRINRLEVVRGGIDPTFSLSQEATVPAGPVGSPSWLVIALSLLAGLTLAAVAALLLEALVRPPPPPPDPFD